MKANKLIFALTASLMLLAQLVHAQSIPATVTTTIDGKQYVGSVTLSPATKPADPPVIIVPPATQPTTAPVVIPPATPDVPVVLHGQPTALTTGISPGVALKSVAGIKWASGATYSNLRINGQVTLTGLTNVMLINCVIDAGGATYGVRCDKATNITIKNCEILNTAAAGIYGDGFQAIGNYIHKSSGDGIKPGSNVLIQGNYITQLGWNAPDAHADGIQIRDGDNIKIVGNFFDMPNGVPNTKANCALFLQLDVTNVTFDGNWVRGGNFGMHVYSDTTGGNATIKITNNVFYHGSTQYGFGNIGSGVVWTGNVTDAGKMAAKGDK